MKVFLLNLVFWPLFVLLSTVGVVVMTIWVGVAAPFRSHRKTMHAFRKAIRQFGLLSLAFMFPWVRIFRSLPNEKLSQPCIYICNHKSGLDAFLMALLPGEIVQVVNIWPFKIPVIGWYARWAGYLSVREIPFDLFLKEAEALLSTGVSIAAFPEGTRSGEGPAGPFHSALFRVAQATGFPVVPVCISGNERIPRKGSWWLRPGRITVKALPPIGPEVFQQWSVFEFKNDVRSRIVAELKEMKGA